MTTTMHSYIDTGQQGSTMYTGYQHAFKLYLSENYKNVPKSAFMYFVKFNVNPKVKTKNNITQSWDQYTALLAKSVQLPKFKITTETINQYNRKTNIQTKLNYEPVTIEMHDDMGGSTNGFWKNYYTYFYADSRSKNISSSYSDNKYDSIDYTYGLNSKGEPYFLSSIDIFVLHQGNFTEMKLINPLITSWEHDTVAQSEGAKVLANKMTIVYEDVIYYTGVINDATGSDAEFFEYSSVYDQTPSPLLNPIVRPIPVTLPDDPLVPINKAAIADPSKLEDPRVEYNMRDKGALTIGSILSTINQAKTLFKNPRQTLNVYGINIKNLVVNTAIGKISAIPVNLSRTPERGNIQGETNFTDRGNQ